MKNKYPILLVLLYALPMVFYFCNLQIEKLHAKHQFELIAKNIQSNIKTVKISSFQIKNNQWKNNHEFSLNGLMYDVIKKVTENNSTTYICLIDLEETEINNKISNLLNIIFGIPQHQNSNKTKILNFYKNTYYNKLITYNIEQTHKSNTNSKYVAILCNSEYYSKINHPPQFV